MNSVQIQDQIYNWALGKNFTSPYGVITGSHTNKKGKKYLSITFGYARTLDATVEIYNRSFIVVRTSRHGTLVFKQYSLLLDFLNTL